MDTHALTTSLLAHVKRNDVKELTGRALGSLLKAITEHEIAEGGPYGALPKKGSTTREADIGLSLLVAEFLHRLDIELPALTAYLKTHENHPASTVLSHHQLEEVLRIAQLRPEHALGWEAVRTARRESERERQMLARIQAAAEARLETLPADVREEALAALARTIAGNPDRQMPLMAYFVREALGKEGKSISDETITALGLANVFFWTAFIIYDDFWDEDEAADPTLLPIANLFARHYVDYFVTLMPNDSGFRIYVQETMDALDAANAWETMHCRMRREGFVLTIPDSSPDYGDYEVKYRPAGGHTLGPTALLLSCGSSLESHEVRNFIEYCKHYLIAMQLNDDAHDWKEDLFRGHISTAVALLLEVWRKKHPDQKTIDLKRDLPELEQLFWREVLSPLCSSILVHTAAARRALVSIRIFADITPLTKFVVRSENAAHQALAERMHTDEFIHVFESA